MENMSSPVADIDPQRIVELLIETNSRLTRINSKLNRFQTGNYSEEEEKPDYQTSFTIPMLDTLARTNDDLSILIENIVGTLNDGKKIKEVPH